jgi:hypothetical protein
MKRYYLLIAFLLSLFYKPGQAQRPTMYQMTSKPGVGQYVLNIDQDKIMLTGYYAPYHSKGNFVIVPLKFTNKSADTLRYLTFSCSWNDIYKVSNGNIKVFKWPCEKNVVKIIEVLPNETTIVSMPITISNAMKNRRQKFKIGIHLVKVKGWGTGFYQFEAALKDEKNVIWSNEVETP